MAKILIVDDEPRIRELIHEHLQYSGYICEEAGTALRRWHSCPAAGLIW